MGSLRVMVVGAAGRMGSEVVRAVAAADDLELAAAVDRVRVGEDAFAVAGLPGRPLPITDSLSDALARGRPEAAVDFTVPGAIMANARIALAARVPYVIGATGLTEGDLEELAGLSAQHATPVLVVPNFAIGAVLMMQFAAQAARYFDSAEIIELHHDKKLDSPSGTARATARRMVEARRERVFERERCRATRAWPVRGRHLPAQRPPARAGGASRSDLRRARADAHPSPRLDQPRVLHARSLAGAAENPGSVGFPDRTRQGPVGPHPTRVEGRVAKSPPLDATGCRSTTLVRRGDEWRCAPARPP